MSYVAKVYLDGIEQTVIDTVLATSQDPEIIRLIVYVNAKEA